ncbi:MAG TPA: CAP domain-containing protein [Phycisphaerae bacterium]|nr:CAP domain-containing protein [Phycisphaerae bacterium]HRR86498.1 CAP domain-containing protein [Phycisphaerae bacterium]
MMRLLTGLLWRTSAVVLLVSLPACVGGLPLPGIGGFPDVLGDDANDPGAGASGYCEPIGTPDTSTQQQMLNALNNYRLANGLGILMYSDSLEQAAQAHAQDMHARNFFDHTNPDGKTSFDRAVAAGFCSPLMVGENIAYGQQSVADVQAGWEGSPGHNANMLHTGYAFVGMGHYVSFLGEHYWVQVFGTTFE